MPLSVGAAGSPPNTMSPGPRPYLHTKWHLDPCNRLATIHQRYRQRDRQDNGPVLGEPLLVTVDQKPMPLSPKVFLPEQAVEQNNGTDKTMLTW